MPLPFIFSASGARLTFFLFLAASLCALLWTYWSRRRAHYFALLRHPDRLPPAPTFVIPARAPVSATLRRELERMRGRDAGFSVTVLESFVRLLFHEAHGAGKAGVARVRTRFSEAARTALATRMAQPARDVLVGGIRYESVDGLGGELAAFVLGLVVEASWVENLDGRDRRVYVVERWLMRRRHEAAPGADDKREGCLRCGAPNVAVSSSACSRCGEVAAAGDWVVEDIELRDRRLAPPAVTVEEAQHEMPAVVFPAATVRLRELCDADPQISWQALQARVTFCFGEVYAARSSRDPARMRPWVTDVLFAREAYWAEVYARQGLRRVWRDVRVESIVLSRMASDVLFDAFTVRVNGAAVVFTTDDAGAVVAGSSAEPHRLHEYWTLIRRRTRTGPVQTEAVCPSCRAPLKTGDDGECKACRARLPTGAYDWVVERIDPNVEV